MGFRPAPRTRCGLNGRLYDDLDADDDFRRKRERSLGDQAPRSVADRDRRIAAVEYR